MRTAIPLVSALAFAARCFAQAVDEGIEPDEPAPAGCKTTVDGNFTIGIATLVPRGANERRETAQEAAGSALACTLKDGILKDPYGRVGSVVANYQFQFDGPPQAGAIFTGGFSVCQNGSLALGDSTVWYRCMSGEFGNLYDRSIGDQCSEVRIVAQQVDKPLPTSSSPASPASSSASATPSPTSISASSQSSQNSTSASGSTTVSSSSWSIESASVTETILPPSDATATPTDDANATEVVGGQSPEKTGLAAPQRIPRRETFGAVVGVLGVLVLF